MADLEWAVEPARSGELTLAVGGHAVHSRYDPLREAAALAARAAAEITAAGADAAILLGLGLGYLPAALREHFAGQLLIWDPFPEMTGCVPLHPGAWQAALARLEAMQPDQAA